MSESNPLRVVRLQNDYTLVLWDTGRLLGNKDRLGYKLVQPDGAVLFKGEDYGASPVHGVDSDATLLALLSFLTLKPGDIDSDYFANYTPAQMAWATSSECESLYCDVSMAEEAIKGDGCACAMWTNTDDGAWECEGAGNIREFEVLDHGEDGSQYFPGCGVAYTKFQHVATGVGDTARKALEDALEQMATSEPEARPSALQEFEMVRALDNPDASAFQSLDHSECGEDHEGDDWNHYVSVRYNLRGES